MNIFSNQNQNQNQNQIMISQGNDFLNTNNRFLTANQLSFDQNLNNNLINQTNTLQNQNNVTKEYTEMEKSFNQLLNKYSNLQNKIMQDTVNGNINKADVELLNSINNELTSLGNELDKKISELQNVDKDLMNKITSQQQLLRKYHNDINLSSDNYSSHSPSLNELTGEVDSSYDYYRYSYAWYIMYLFLAIIIFYLIFSISANGFSASNGLLIVVVALLGLYFIKRFIDYSRWSWNLQIPSWKPHINFEGPKVVFQQYI